MSNVSIQFLSDTHLEFRELPFDKLIKPPIIDPLTGTSKFADVVALLGDIADPTSAVYSRLIAWCAERFKIVLVVLGNHEYYTKNTAHTIQAIDSHVRHMCEVWPNVRLLQNETVQYQDVVFVGSTLWSYIPPEHNALIQGTMNDYKLIYDTPGTLLTAHKSSAMFVESMRFLERTICTNIKANLKTVVLTHHTPSFKETSAPCFTGKPGNHAFSSDLSAIHSPRAIRLWLCGHTHFNFHHNLEGYELVSNQYGYKNRCENGFLPNKVIYV
jgi:predicted phosphohydrolase